MSEKLVKKLLTDIEQREAKDIESRAAELDRALGFVSEEELLRERTWAFLRAMHKNRGDARRRGFIARLLHGTVQRRTESYTDYMEPDFLTTNEDTKKYVTDKQPLYMERGTRTHIFDEAEYASYYGVFGLGWQVGEVSSRTIVNPSIGTARNERSGGAYFIYAEEHPLYEPIEGATKPVRIWRTATSTGPSGEQVVYRVVTHDIDRGKGALTTYAEDPQADEILNPSAIDFVIKRLQIAVEFLEQ